MAIENKNDQDKETMVIAYLELTESRIKETLMSKANYSSGGITEEMISNTMEIEKKKVMDEVDSQSIIDAMLNLLNIVEERLKYKFLKL